jgi:tetratricopeptide (TPR) repeat protein
VAQELRERVGAHLAEAQARVTPPMFDDVLSDAMTFPRNAPDKAAHEARVREEMERYFEAPWIHRPRVALQNVPPVDAAGHAVLRKKLRGVIEFLEQCARLNAFPYDFDRLRRKLGLLQAPAEAAGGPGDIDAMGAAELAALDSDKLTDAQLEQAYQASQKLDARDLAGQFARALVGRPPQPDRPDRFPWYNHLVNQALAEGSTAAALEHLAAAAKADAEQNEGRRQNDYDLRRGQIHAKRGELDAAQEAFDRLIERAPGELRYRSGAAEAMLSARQGARALRFAEEGLAKARQQNSRDSEEHFLELVSAARKQGG